jgi:hypothetical protein
MDYLWLGYIFVGILDGTSPLSLSHSIFAYLQINWNGKPIFVFQAFLS